MTLQTKLTDHLRKNGSITLIDSIALLGITDLQKVVSKCRRKYGKSFVQTSHSRYKTLGGEWKYQPEYILTETGRSKIEKKPWPLTQ